METLRGPRVSLLRLMLLLAGVCIDAYRPVIIVHGLFDEPKNHQNLTRFIEKVHPGTTVKAISLYNNLASMAPMWTQVKGFRAAIDPIMKSAPDGVHLLCYSQGGLICRALLATTPYHNVHSFISLSSPQAGQYGITGTVRRVFPKSKKNKVYRICYNRLGQKLSVCNYWKDPHHLSRYMQSSIFLAMLDGDRANKDIKAWRKNFLRLKKLVLIGGPDDGVITPWQSSHFGFYDSDENIVDMRNQKFYKKDTFGLKTLEARGDVSLCIQSGVQHSLWISNFTVFTRCIEKWLT